MCLIVLAAGLHPRYRLVVAANRDEAHHRATAPMGFWPQAPQVLAGRDLEAGGTWLGVTRGGRFAAVTNFREPGRRRPDAPSRGALVAGFLTSRQPSRDFIGDLQATGSEYNGFNLLASDGEELYWFSNRDPNPRRLGHGLHGLSNHLLDTPWPKVERCKHRLATLLRDGAEVHTDAVLELLDDREPAAEHELPLTGVPVEWERLLSAPFICHPEYGTRSSTALLVDHDGRLTCTERRFDPGGTAVATTTFGLRFEPAPAAIGGR